MLSVAMFSSCFTGIENTGHISEKDVEKARAGERTAEDAYLDSIVPAPYASWQEGKQFYVADNNIRLIFSPQTDSLQGSTLRYVGSESFRQIDNTEEAVLGNASIATTRERHFASWKKPPHNISCLS